MSKQKFSATLRAEGRSLGLIELPFDVPTEFGGKRVPVHGQVNGHPFRTTVAVYGGRYYIGFNREVRDAAGIEAGQVVTVELERDDAPRVVDVPDDLVAALKMAPKAQALFDELSFTHRREYVRWITEAKRVETRRGRVEKTIAMLEGGTRHP